jgi:DNA repair exonuclease SbcCD ATPase subunit
LLAELKQKQDEVRRSEMKLKDVSSGVDELKIQFNSLETQTNKNKADSMNNNSNWQNEVTKGKELLAKLNNVETTIRSR